MVSISNFRLNLCIFVPAFLVICLNLYWLSLSRLQTERSTLYHMVFPLSVTKSKLDLNIISLEKDNSQEPNKSALIEHKPQLTHHVEYQWRTNLSELNKLTYSQLQPFFEFKEKQYADRRERIANVCKKMIFPKAYPLPGNETESLKQFCTIYIEPKRHLSYCPIPKVASTTWRNKFISMTHKAMPTLWAQENRIMHICEEPLRIPEGVDVPGTFANTSSLLIVRHPLNRMASAYWHFKLEAEEKHYKYFKPGENFDKLLTQYELAKKSGDYNKFNQHWRPHYTNCPVCAHNFSVISHYEQMHEDHVYYAFKNNLTKLTQFRGNTVRNLSYMRLNSSQEEIKITGLEKDYYYWKDIEPRKIVPFLDLYAYDMEMHDYSVKDYFDAIGLPEIYTAIKNITNNKYCNF